MDIEVRLFGKLREVAGVSREIINLERPIPLSGLVAILGEKHGKVFADEVAATRGLRILVNGREFQILAGMETTLIDRDSVVLLPPIEGG